MKDLEKQFENELHATVVEARALGYNPTIFARMLKEKGGVMTAKQLVLTGDVQSGFKRLAELGRLDISMECKMLKSEYKSCFTEEELQAARWRYDQACKL